MELWLQRGTAFCNSSKSRATACENKTTNSRGRRPLAGSRNSESERHVRRRQIMREYVGGGFCRCGKNRSERMNERVVPLRFAKLFAASAPGA